MTVAWVMANALNAGARAMNHAATALAPVFVRVVTDLAQPIQMTSVVPAAAAAATAEPARAAAKRNAIIVAEAAPAMRAMAAEHDNPVRKTSSASPALMVGEAHL